MKISANVKRISTIRRILNIGISNLPPQCRNENDEYLQFNQLQTSESWIQNVEELLAELD